METALVLQFAVTAGLFTMIPGADWAYAIAAGLRSSSSRALAVPVLGLASGYVILVCIVAVGVGALIAANPAALTLLTVIGSCYIIYLGVSTLLSLRQSASTLVPTRASDEAEESGLLGSFFGGMGISGLNPKGLMLLLALLPQFLTHDGWASGIQIMLLGGIFVIETLLIYSGVAVLARTLLQSRPRLNRAVSVASGIFLTLFGTWLLVDSLLA
ncbi:MAG TPA: LysE family translocator [Candidatus Corynebacterium avicola]|uniref:LysE family translocator n=1 Tax=Candidatus Corynebacterium avicola TaxID=2838527 RepID=A0A9D1UM96_9CORY|nr:LysE family translocator [Candidatus Corynebacterium avicola]